MCLLSIRRLLALACLVGAAAGCARQPYAPRPLDMEEAARRHAARTLTAPELGQAVRARGSFRADWPPAQWGLDALTLAAFHYRDELQAARARGAAARANVEVAAQRAPWRAAPRIERHSGEGERDTPWSLGFELELPLASAARRSAAVGRAQAQAQAAELEVGEQAWRIRRELRAQLLDLHAARRDVDSLERELAAHREVVDMLERRLQEGYAGASEVDAARLRLAEAMAELHDARTRAARALGGVAQAIGVPTQALTAIEFSFASFDALPQLPEAAHLRRDALVNRLDLRRSLLDFEAADAEVKLAVAQQYPSFSITPGFLWDQGDNVWSLAVDLLLPATLTHGPALRAAQAQREASATQALALQSAVLGEVDACAAVYARARGAADAAQQALHPQQARSAQIQRRFDGGQADRLELTLSRIEALLVERRAANARVQAQRALGELEDAMQQPLPGGPADPVEQDTGGKGQ